MKTNVQDMTGERTLKKWVWGQGVVDLILLAAGDSNTHFISKAGFLAAAAAAFLVVDLVDSNFELSKQGNYSCHWLHTHSLWSAMFSGAVHKACETDRLTASWW